MNFLESITSAIKNVVSNKTRALLTMLGIIIGIGSVIIITSIGQGQTASMTEQFEQMGVGRLTVSTASRGVSISQSDSMTIKDYEVLKEYEEIKYIAGTYTANNNLKLLDPKETKNATLTGINGDYESIMSPTVLYGRYLNESDMENAAKVVVINDTTADKVFGKRDQSVIGQKISIRTNRGVQKYTVVGILENSNAEMETMFGDQYPETIYMPLATLQRLYGVKTISQITVVVQDTDKIDDVASEITAKLDKLHGTTDKYYVQNPSNMIDQVTSMLDTIVTFIAAVAGISLFVGGIGVMNIMLVTVTERTREIGIRKSIGATNNDIRLQFLIEAIILTGLGGVLGLAFGYAGGKLVASLLSMSAIVSNSAVILAIGISSAIGIVFGVYPASKAAKLDPIEALRYE